jgi:hypothetical protein
MIRASDGLDYEDLTQRLLGEPAKTVRNAHVQRLREDGRSKAFTKAWIEAYDGFKPSTDPQGAFGPYGNTVLAAQDEFSRRAQAHVAGLAADGHYDPPAPEPEGRRSPG